MRSSFKVLIALFSLGIATPPRCAVAAESPSSSAAAASAAAASAVDSAVDSAASTVPTVTVAPRAPAPPAPATSSPAASTVVADMPVPASAPASAPSAPETVAAPAVVIVPPAAPASAPDVAPVAASAPAAAASQSMSESELNNILGRIEQKLGARATEITANAGDVRELDLRERSLARRFRDVERRIRTIEAMAKRTDDQYALMKEKIYSENDFLLYGCFIFRALSQKPPAYLERPLDRPVDARLGSVICGVMDALTFVIPVRLARINPTMRTIIDDAFSRRQVLTSRGSGQIVRTMPAHRYPASVALLRTAAWAVGGLMLTEQVLTLSYADEIDYRTNLGRLSPEGVSNELAHQLKNANDLNFELAATRAAKINLTSIR